MVVGLRRRFYHASDAIWHHYLFIDCFYSDRDFSCLFNLSFCLVWLIFKENCAAASSFFSLSYVSYILQVLYGHRWNWSMINWSRIFWWVRSQNCFVYFFFLLVGLQNLNITTYSFFLYYLSRSHQYNEFYFTALCWLSCPLPGCLITSNYE